MPEFIDLHCHWVAGIDDGPSDPSESRAMLERLGELGFARVVATPHMRPGLFDNTAHDIRAAYESTFHTLEGVTLPETDLACEHFFDDVVFSRIIRGEGLPYPGNNAILIELGYDQSPAMLSTPLFEVRRKGFRPVLAHPERYRVSWSHPDAIEKLEDFGVVMLLDILALVGTYGRKARKRAERWLEEGMYYAACTDAHSLKHVSQLDSAIRRLEALVGREETLFLLSEGPRQILDGTVRL